MDMQFENIINVTEICAINMTAGDIYNSNTVHTQNLNLDGNLIFSPGSIISINGVIVDPLSLTTGNQASHSDHEARIHVLELEKKELMESMIRMQSKIENLEKWVQL